MLIPHNPITNSLFGWFLGVKMSKLDRILEGYKWLTLPPPAILLHNFQLAEGEVFSFLCKCQSYAFELLCMSWSILPYHLLSTQTVTPHIQQLIGKLQKQQRFNLEEFL